MLYLTIALYADENLIEKLDSEGNYGKLLTQTLVILANSTLVPGLGMIIFFMFTYAFC